MLSPDSIASLQKLCECSNERLIIPSVTDKERADRHISIASVTRAVTDQDLWPFMFSKILDG